MVQSLFGVVILNKTPLWLSVLFIFAASSSPLKIKSDPVNEAKLLLGQALFFDKVLSGNKNISCATCHHPSHGTSDGLSLGFGEGGVGLGPERTLGNGEEAVPQRIPRHSPHLFNLGDPQVTALFHDGRIQFNDDLPSGIQSPAGNDLPEGLESLLAAQALFPLQSDIEMAGQEGENVVATVAATGDFRAVWRLLTERLKEIPAYVELFQRAYPEIESAKDINIIHVGNAIGFFEAEAFKSNSSRFDLYQMDSERYPLTEEEELGRQVFFGKANCNECHSGSLFTDGEFKSIAFPQIGPGTGNGFQGLDDFGREKVTGQRKDRYKFRTPSLKNITRTAPYGHTGAYASLEAMVIHYVNPPRLLERYIGLNRKVVLPYREDLAQTDYALLADLQTVRDISESHDVPRIRFNRKELDALLAFLGTLEEVDFDVKYQRWVPKSVPSGLPVDR